MLGTTIKRKQLLRRLKKAAGVAKWQTHYFEVVAPRGVGVQVPPPALWKMKKPDDESGFFVSNPCLLSLIPTE